LANKYAKEKKRVVELIDEMKKLKEINDMQWV
jgi:hypothetical protein